MQIMKAGNLFKSGGTEAPKPTVRRKYRYLKGFTVMRIIALALFFGILGVRGEGQNVFNVPTPAVENPLAKEGLALSRIVFSPVNILGHSYAQIEHYGGVGIVLSPILIVTNRFNGHVQALRRGGAPRQCRLASGRHEHQRLRFRRSCASDGRKPADQTRAVSNGHTCVIQRQVVQQDDLHPKVESRVIERQRRHGVAEREEKGEVDNECN